MNKEERKIIQKAKIVIATHEYATGFAQHLEEYLIHLKNQKFLYVHHPLHPYYPTSNGSGYRMYINGGLQKEVSFQNKYLFLLSLFFKNFLQDLWWVMQQREKWDLYIGSNNLNAFAGVLLKKMGLVKKCVFYTVDFVPKRFENPVINSIYLFIDKISVKNCDETWILSPRVKEGRKQYYHLENKFEEKQIYVPEGIWFGRIKRNSFDDILKHMVVFTGILLQRMGAQLIIQSIPLITKKCSEFRFVIIGKGDYKSQLEALVKKLHVEKHVDFKGYIEDFKDVEKTVAKCALGVATYTNDPSKLTYYADPAKVKTYLGCGIPVIMTNTFHNAVDIEKRGAGIVVSENPNQIAKAILSLIHNKKRLKIYRENAVKLAQEFDNDTIFTRNLLRILD